VTANVRSGPSGENPSGSVAAVNAQLGIRFESSSIACLSVKGRTAPLAGQFAPNPFLNPLFFKATLLDGGPSGAGPDTLAAFTSNSPQDCSTPLTGVFEPLLSGGFAVTDAPPFMAGKGSVGDTSFGGGGGPATPTSSRAAPRRE
jgi:hypothetical protein